MKLVLLPLLFLLTLVGCERAPSGSIAAVAAGIRDGKGRIVFIDRDDPDVQAFERFAADHNQRWAITPDAISQKDYCAILQPANKCKCESSIKAAVATVEADFADTYDVRDVRIGNY